MGITISGATGIDMGNTPISNISIVNSGSVVDKAYVDDLKIIATGTATFTNSTNNINLTGIGIGVEIGDVIQISGAEDAKNNSEFTVEVITDDDNIIVNQAHANKGTSKNVATRASDTGVTVKLLAKWYNADSSLGRDWVNVYSSRSLNVQYPNNTFRPLKLSVNTVISGVTRIYKDGTSTLLSTASGSGSFENNITLEIARGSNYTITGAFASCMELR